MERELKAFYAQLDNLYAAGNQNEIEQFLINKATEYKPEVVEENALYIAALNELGAYYRGISQYDLSKQVFSAAGDMLRLYPGEESAEYATLLINLAGTYRLAGEYRQAIDYFEQATAILRKNQLDKSYFYASALNNLALVYQTTKEYEKAIGLFREALTLLEGKPEYHTQTATTYSNLALSYGMTGNREAFKEYIDKSIKKFEETGNAGDPHYAGALNNLAALCYTQKEYAQALELYQKIASITKHYFGENVEYAITCQSMSNTYEAMGDHAAAISCLETAVGLFAKIFGAGSEKYAKATAALANLRDSADAK